MCYVNVQHRTIYNIYVHLDGNISTVKEYTKKKPMCNLDLLYHTHTHTHVNTCV